MAELNGSPVDGEDLKSLALVNFAHFTSMRIEPGGRVRGWDLHMQRLARDCMTVFGTELDTENIRVLVRQAVTQIETSTTVRVTVFDPGLDMGRMGAKADPDVLVTTRPAAVLPLPALKVATATFSRELPHVKHAGLMASLYHRRVAQQAGFDDALFTEANGDITEGVTWNVGFIDANEVIWPSGNVLPGTTASLIGDIHRPSVSAKVNTGELHGMQAAFATNVSYGVRPIEMIDGHHLDTSHPLLAELSEKYLAIEPDQI